MERHKGFQFVCTLLIIVGILSLLLGAVRFVSDVAASVPIGQGAAVLAFGFICLFLGFGGFVLADIERNTRK
jgi:hypothetical protein